MSFHIYVIYFHLSVDIMWYDINLRYIFLNDLDDKNAFDEEVLEKVKRTVLEIFLYYFCCLLVVATSHTIFPCREQRERNRFWRKNLCIKEKLEPNAFWKLGKTKCCRNL